MVYLFFGSILFLFYTSLGYALTLWLISQIRVRSPKKKFFRPSLSLIIAAHNEARAIEKKIQNCLGLVYPRDKYEVIVVLDGSTDGSAEIARPYDGRGIKLIELPERKGKHYAQMIARDASSGEILVFTDVSVHLQPEVLETLAENFADEKVGCVSSEDYFDTAQKGWAGEHFYIRLEMGLRRLESKVNSLVSVSGSLFAARRSLCNVWHSDQSSDFFVPLHTAAQGLRAIVDPDCRGYYEVPRSEKAEHLRKVRTIVHGLDVFFSHLTLANPFRYGLFSLQLVSHKLFRWLVPFAFLGLLVSSGLLWRQGVFFKICFAVQISVYTAGALALAVESLAKFRPFRLAGFLLVGASATIVAWLKFISGERYVSWQPTRRA